MSEVTIINTYTAIGFTESQYRIQVDSVEDFEFLCNYCREMGCDISQSTSDRYNCKEFPYIRYSNHGLHGNSRANSAPWIQFAHWLSMLNRETELEESEYDIDFLWK